MNARLFLCGALALTLAAPVEAGMRPTFNVSEAAWEASDPHGGRESALRRLRAAASRLGQQGIEIETVVGDADPMVAVEAIWDPERFDEVIVATLPQALSRWLRLDLPRRVERLTGRTVTHVVAHERTPTQA